MFQAVCMFGVGGGITWSLRLVLSVKVGKAGGESGGSIGLELSGIGARRQEEEKGEEQGRSRSTSKSKRKN